jgi:hypothetical protein
MRICFDPAEGEASGGEPIAEPTGADLAREFAAQEAAETPAESTPAEPAAEPEVPTVADEQEVVPNKDQEYFDRLRQGYDALIAQQNEEIARLRAQHTQAVQTPKPAGFDMAEWKKLVDTDPLKAIQVAARHDPEISQLRSELEQFKKDKAESAERAYVERVDMQTKQVEQKYPDFKPGTPLYGATYNWVAQNAQWLRSVSQANPNFNPVEHAYKQVAFDLMIQKSKVQDQKLVDKRNRSVTVRPGATTPVVPSGTSAARLAAADQASKGNVIPDAWVEAAERAEKKYS